MKLIFTITCFSFFCFYTSVGYSQPADYTIAITRQYVHYNLDKQQKQLLALDGKADDILRGSSDDEVNLQLTYTATQKIDAVQKEIELDTTIDNNLKVTYLRGLSEVLTAFGDAVRQRRLKLLYLPEVMQAWQAGYNADKRGQSIEPLIGNYPHAVGAVGKHIGTSLRSQDNYNLEIKQCDLFAMLFYSKVGKYSSEEFELANSLFADKAMPRICVFQKDIDLPKHQGKRDADSRYDFLERLTEIEHFPVLFQNADKLVNELEDAIDKLLQDEVFVKALKVE